ncbi:MAG TPA: hypothetical protein VEV17_07360 [Bryobacteraceae bacterium]|nr:hypothetical protein [Bryobacteraceae bacterium]
MRTSVPAVLIPGILFPLVVTCDVAPPLTLRQVLERMEEQDQLRSVSLARYTCVRRYFLDNHRFHVTAELTARMTYCYPGRKRFEVLSERGPSIIRQRVLRRMLEAEAEASRDDVREHTRITPLNYEFQLLGVEIQQDRPSYVLKATPRSRNKFSLRGRIWVDSEDFAIVRVEAAPAQNPSALIRNTHVVQQYEKLGLVWLPLFNHSETDSFLFGRTEVTIDSRDYAMTRKNGNSPECIDLEKGESRP